MEHSRELDRVSTALVAAARDTPRDASIASVIWPTAGDMVDHVGSVQRWATAILRTGGALDQALHERPADRDPIEWLAEGAAALTAEVAEADPGEACWTFVGPGTKAFWGRRMIHEATKHLWDLRTASDPAPRMPTEVGYATPAAIIDEFDEVFIARARRQQDIAALPGSVLLRSSDSDRSWLVERDWQVTRDPQNPTASAVLTATTADIALLLWERADPWALPDRFRRTGDDAAIRALRDTPVHL